MSDEQAAEIAAKVIKQFIKELGYEGCEICITDDTYLFVMAGEKGVLKTEGEL